MNTKKANYTIGMAPKYITLECPYCELDFDIDYGELVKSTCSEDGHEKIWMGNGGVMVTCDYCEQEVELGEAEVD